MTSEIILGYLVSGFVGVVIGVLFDEPLRSAKQRFIRWVRSIFRKKEEIPSPVEFELGSLKTSFIVVDGNGKFEYTPETLICRFEDRMIELPPEIKH